ncbi:MAG: M14 family metallopeptidase [Acidimicrobiia bacterium]
MPDLAFDHLYGYDELTAALHELAAAAPELMTVEPAGTSHEGRTIWLATVTNSATGPHTDKPAVFVEANIHATEITASTAALHLLHHLTTGYGTDPAVTRALDTRTFYVIPRVNPDGVELALAADPTYLRSSTRVYPRPDQQPGLVDRDVDGDGRILLMRIADPDGAWRVHPDDARLLVPRAFDDVSDGPFYRLLPEGEVHDFDPDRVPLAPEHRGLDLNRNFPQDWEPEGDQHGSGPFPTSEPEVRAVVEAVVARPNIGVYFAHHTYAGVILRPYGGHADDHFPTADLKLYTAMGKRATEITGYAVVSVFHDFKYDPKTSITGCGDEWAYDHLGIFGWTTEFWSPLRAAGLKDAKYIEWYEDHDPADDLTLLRWNDDVLGGTGFVDWYPFEHPQLGPVELGGWDFFRTWSNAPTSLMAAEVAPHSTWAVAQALALPELAVHDVRVERLGDDTWHVRAVVKNRGWLPTNITKKAVERKAVRPVELELTVPEGAELVAGRRVTEIDQLPGRSRARAMLHAYEGGYDPTTDRGVVDWTVRAPAGTELEVTARHARAGVDRRTLTLG